MARFQFDFTEPIICTAIHAGHTIEPWLKKTLLLNEETCLREEDPYTDFFTIPCKNRIIADISRFQVDLNRNRDMAIYQKPDDAWGLNIREYPLTNAEMEKALIFYDSFYQKTREHVEKLIHKFGSIFVYDIHSYNHRRQGEEAEFDPQTDNPDMILGTNNMPSKWFPLVDSIQAKLLSLDYYGSKLDVRQNVKFSGGHFSYWLHEQFPEHVCCIALEFKKIFMNEWTGLIDMHKQTRLREILWETYPVIRQFLANH
jgi:N-formylglutamate amidohydrolase